MAIDELQGRHELLGRRTAARDAEADDAASSLGQVFLGESVVCVVFEAGEADPGDFRMLMQEFGNGLAVFAMLRHTDMQALETHVE